MQITDTDRPLAIAMWDFSWLERRWPGGGFEDWAQVLDELCDRGYDVVRIDVYPHLIANDPTRSYTLPFNQMPQNDWGTPGKLDVTILPDLLEFLELCEERDLQVGISTWFRKDEANTQMQVETPTDLGEIWVETLTVIEEHGFADTICFVDLCNEFPVYIRDNEFFGGENPMPRHSDAGGRWMTDSIETVRAAFPEYDYTHSFSIQFDTWDEQDVSAFDFLELHLWMEAFADFKEELGVHPGEDDYLNTLAGDGADIYDREPDRWKQGIDDAIDFAVEWSTAADLPLVTTESWAVAFAKDWPRLDWRWIKELCEYGVRESVDTGRWAGVSTSNFCEPQFHGMWTDEDWHRELTDYIRNGDIDV